MLEENQEELVTLSRNQEQEKVFFVIYQALFLARMGKEYDIVEIIEDNLETSFDEAPIFVKETAVKVLAHYDEIKAIIEPNCNKWKFERINLVVISILMLGIGEFKYIENTEKSVIIDVCVKLAHKYGDKKDYAFVNALLDKVL